MPKNKTAVAVPLLLALVCVAGSLFRRTSLEHGFEIAANLPIPVRNSAPNTAFIIFSAIVMLCALGFALYVRERRGSAGTYAEAFAPHGPVLQLVSTFYGMALIAAAVGIYRATRETATTGDNALVALCVAAAIAVVIVAVMVRQKKINLFAQICSLVPELFFTLWLIDLYRQNQTNPTLLLYAPRAIAIAGIAFSFYFIAGYMFGKRAPLRVVFAHIIGIFFSCVSLAGALPLYETILFAASAVFLMYNLMRFTLNLTACGAGGDETPKDGAEKDDGTIST